MAGDVRTGRVASFDEDRGLGTVEADDGTVVPFHCTAVADGSRSIAESTRVRFRVVPGHLGVWEAAHLEPEGR